MNFLFDHTAVVGHEGGRVHAFGTDGGFLGIERRVEPQGNRVGKEVEA